MPGGGGLELLRGLRALNPEIPVIVMTAYGTVASAVEAMKQGAADYLSKPVDLDELELLVARTLERRALESENRELREQLADRHRLEGLETANPRMAQAINIAARAAASRATILIRGESGTGKELLARAVHSASPRARSPAGGGQRRGASGDAARVGDVRPRARGLHRGRPPAPRALRAGGRRDALPRRDRRPAEGGHRPSCSVRSRSSGSSGSEARARSRSTCGWWRPRAGISRPWFGPRSSGRISTTA